MPARLLSIPLSLYALDQATKALVTCHLAPGARIEVVPGFFDLFHIHNTGMVWGLMRGHNAFFIAFALCALVVLAGLAFRGVFRDPWSRAGLLLLLPGIAGNLTDRLLHGHVIDFLFFHAGRFEWPAFNVADSCISLAVVCFIVASFRPDPAG